MNNDIEIIEDTSNKKKSKKVKQIIFASFLFVLLVVGVFVGYSSAYFTSTVINNPTPRNTNVTTGSMEIEFTDGETVGLINALPGSHVIKTFKVKNVGSLAAYYDVYMSDLVNTFSDKTDLVYTLTSNDGGANIATQTQIPSTSSKIVSSQPIAINGEHNYTLRIDFKETNDDQDDNKRKSFRTVIRINEVQEPVLTGPTIDTSDIYTSANVKQEGVKGIVYLDPQNLTRRCDENNSSVGSGINGCLKFYIYDDSGDNYKMILDHNTGNGILWSDIETYTPYESSNVYTHIQSLLWDNSINTTIISMDEINTLTGKTDFIQNIEFPDSYYLDDVNAYYVEHSKGSSKFAWLTDYLDRCEENAGCDTEITNTGAESYWSSSINYYYHVWHIGHFGAVYSDSVVCPYIGVRPVITVSKSTFE